VGHAAIDTVAPRAPRSDMRADEADSSAGQRPTRAPFRRGAEIV